MPHAHPIKLLFGLSVLLMLASPPPARAQEENPLRTAVDGIAQPFFAEEAVPRAMVAVSRRGVLHYFGYSGTGAEPLGRDSIVEIGSITKVFTTALLQQSVDAGTLSLDTPLRAALPDADLRPCTARITLRQLADFRSGMPLLPGGVPRELRDRGIETYTTADYLGWLSRWTPGEEPDCGLPAPYFYSNASVGLLGPILARANGMDWERQIAEAITIPLGMTDTMARPGPERRARVVHGWTRNGERAPDWPFYAWYAAGALRSTPADMLRFGEAALGHATTEAGPVPPALGKALAEAMQPIYKPRVMRAAQGLAWAIADDGAGAAYKDGGTAGFNTVLVVDPASDTTIFIAANRAGTPVQRLGLELIRALP